MSLTNLQAPVLSFDEAHRQSVVHVISLRTDQRLTLCGLAPEGRRHSSRLVDALSLAGSDRQLRLCETCVPARARQAVDIHRARG